MPNNVSQKYLFGGDKPWQTSDWISSDDRVRGGSSVSNLTCLPFSPVAKFSGNLDTKTLGGAGFASQRTTGERSWDLSDSVGIELAIDTSDGKEYTFILKDDVLPKSENGREQSTTSWEYDFKPDKGEKDKIFIEWDAFKATYRGREQKDAKPLNLKNIKRMSLMMRSFFGNQEGAFDLSIVSISAIAKSTNMDFTGYRDDPNGIRHEKLTSQYATASTPRGWFAWFCGGS